MAMVQPTSRSQSPERFVVKHLGRRQVGKPVRDIKTALQRAYDLVADVDMNSLSKREREQLMYTIEAI